MTSCQLGSGDEASPPRYFQCMHEKNGGARRWEYFNILREHRSASMHAISLLISHTSQGAWQGIRLKLPPSPFCVLTCLLLVSFPDPAPKRRGKGLGTGERLLGLAGFGCARRHRQRSNKPRIWLVCRLYCYIPAGSESYDRAKAVFWLVYLKTKLLMMHNQENARQSPDPFPFILGRGLGTRLTHAQ